MLQAGAFHRLLDPPPPLPSPLSPGGFHQLLAGPRFADWAASHRYLQLSVWLTVLAACQHQQAHVVD